MGWAVGTNDNDRDIGYGVPSICDHPTCKEEIDRGVSYACGYMHDGGERGCGLYFCSNHLSYGCDTQLCERCYPRIKSPFKEKPDTQDWLNWKLTDESWEDWRKENPDKVNIIKRYLKLDKGD